MATTASGSGSGGRQPSGGSNKGLGHQASSSTPPSGDGKTPQTATWASGLDTGAKTYVVNGIGLFPRYRRVNVDEARGNAQVYQILDGDTYHVVTQLPAGPMANPSMPAATAVAQQEASVIAQENIVATGSGAAAQQYHAAQAHRE